MSAGPPRNIRPPAANTSSRGPRVRPLRPLPQNSLPQQLPRPAPRALPSPPPPGISPSVRKLLDQTIRGGVRGVCNEHCNPQCLWDQTKDSWVSPLPNYTPSNSDLELGCKQLCRDETCSELDTAARQGVFDSVVERAKEAIPGMKHLPMVKSLGEFAANAYKQYGEEYTGTYRDKVEAATRKRQEVDPRKSPGFIVMEQPRSMPGGTRHRGAKRTRRQKKKQQRKSRKHKRTKRRHSGRRGTRTQR